MLKKSLTIVFCLLFAGVALADEATDMAPNIIQHNNQSDAQWDVVFDYDVQGLTGDNRCLGPEFDGVYFWVSGAGLAGTEQNMHIFDANGNWVQTFNTVATSYWGIRDMCFDGTYIYGGWESGFECYDAATYTHIMTMTFPGGANFPRANACDPAGAGGAGSFYSGNFANTMYEFDRSGNLIRNLSPGPTAVYGMAWDNTPSGGGPWLWIHDQGGSGTDCYQYDPVTGAGTGLVVVLPVGGGSPIAGGLAYTEDWDPAFSTMIAVGQSTSDAMTGFEMYALGPPPNFAISMTPVSTPIQIPASGGSFDFMIQVTNNDSATATSTGWIMVELPSGTMYGPVLGPVGVTLAAGVSIERLRTQAVPVQAPAGDYNYIGYVGYYPDNYTGTDEFPFTKLAAGNGPLVYEWGCYETPIESVPANFKLSEAYPNPFNPTANINFVVSEASDVKIQVYDINGRHIRTLVDGFYNAGSYDVVFNADHLPSGVYFYNMTAYNFADTQKMLLVK
ncbi:MAG: T9SS type A sorting domain-containing protein [FCB group bacterium]|nr:T9SS type A sorting domain-containing protein [FCB group bacterium]